MGEQNMEHGREQNMDKRPWNAEKKTLRLRVSAFKKIFKSLNN
jgi:hypothetical protein